MIYNIIFWTDPDVLYIQQNRICIVLGLKLNNIIDILTLNYMILYNIVWYYILSFTICKTIKYCSPRQWRNLSGQETQSPGKLSQETHILTLNFRILYNII